MAARRKTNQGQTLLPESMVIFLRRRGQELFGSFLFIAGVYTLLALLSYDMADPSLNTAVDGQVLNIGGPLGASYSDFMLQGFGWSALLASFFLFSWARIKLFHKPLNRLWLKLLLIPFTLASLAMILGLVLPKDAFFLTYQGGAVGAVFSDLLMSKLLFIGKPFAWVLLFFTSSVTFFTLFVYVSGIRGDEWLRIFDFIQLTLVTIATYALYTFRFAVSRFNGQEAPAVVPKPRKSPPLARAPAAKTKIETTYAPDFEEPAFEAEEDAPLDLKPSGDYQLPSLDLLLKNTDQGDLKITEDQLQESAHHLKEVLEEFGIRGDIVKIRPGPVVTLYELVPAPGIKSSRVIGLADDIARSMSSISARVAVIPGRNAIGIELPNDERLTVYLRELLASNTYEKTSGALPLALGQDISGSAVLADLTRMPHLLVAGTTGSGKSVSVNSMILSLLFRLPPDRCKMIMIDPKMLELSVYDGIPHLLSPVVTDPKKAVVALKWAVREMENRYRAMSKLGVRNIVGYNARVAEAKKNGEELSRKVQTGFDSETGKPIYETQPLDLSPLPYIVIIVDEMADLMLVAGKDIEAAVQRLAQMARAAGIHLIMATQRPSVDVITGTIKANFPTRISFQVTSKIDSRTILGEQGAEQLLGMGDMLFMVPGGRVTRVHGPFVTDQEVEEVVKQLKSQGSPDYLEDITVDSDEAPGMGETGSSGDDLYDQAVALILREGKVSTSFIQRHLQIGYNRAARIVEKMETEGIISEASRTGKREILVGQ